MAKGDNDTKRGAAASNKRATKSEPSAQAVKPSAAGAAAAAAVAATGAPRRQVKAVVPDQDELQLPEVKKEVLHEESDDDDQDAAANEADDDDDDDGTQAAARALKTARRSARIQVTKNGAIQILSYTPKEQQEIERVRAGGKPRTQLGRLVHHLLFELKYKIAEPEMANVHVNKEAVFLIKGSDACASPSQAKNMPGVYFALPCTILGTAFVPVGAAVPADGDDSGSDEDEGAHQLISTFRSLGLPRARFLYAVDYTFLGGVRGRVFIQ
jgi:hypothetical protein